MSAPEWKEALLKYGAIAYERGQKLEFNVLIRANKRIWRIELRELKGQGEDSFVEFED
jgi:hypothetical protein